MLALVAPVLAEFALKFGSTEFFWLAVFGIVISGRLTSVDDPIKGWIAGVLGLLVAMVGQEGIHAYQRFSYGSTDLAGGFGSVAGAGRRVRVRRSPAGDEEFRSTRPSVPPATGSCHACARSTQQARTIVRSGLIGTFMGLLPGVGEDMGAWASYAAARRASKAPEEYGKGSVEGLIASETGNNAAVPGAIIPVLTLAVPGSAPAAVLLAAMFIHGVRPGPLIMIEFPSFIFEVVAMVFAASVAILVLGLLLTRPLLLVLRVSREKLMPVVFVLCTVGSFAIASRVFDIRVMLGFGILGFFLREMKYPMAPFVLGIVLGDILDKNFRRAMVLSDGSLEPFFTRPISAVLAAITLGVIVLAIPPVRRLIGSLVRLIPFGRSHP